MKQRDALHGFDCFFGKPEGRMDMSLNGTRLRFFPTADVLAPRECGRLLFF